VTEAMASPVNDTPFESQKRRAHTQNCHPEQDPFRSELATEESVVENAKKRVEVMPTPEVMPPAEAMPPRMKPLRSRWVLVLAGIGIASVAILALVVWRLQSKESHAAFPVTEVQAMSGNSYIGCGGGVTVCGYSFPSNVTKGNALLVGVALNDAPSVTLTSSGAGCRSTKWAAKAEANYSRFLSESTFVGVASGSGPCQVTATVPSPTAIGIQLGEYSGVGDPPIDAYGTLAENGGANVAFSAGNAVTVPGDLAVVVWCSQHINSSSAAGWAATFNQSYMGAFTQNRIGSGTTLNFASTNFPDAGVTTAVMLVLKD
jgi:hypothetical protein